uniref:C-reactive protein 1 n=1 Tax=Macrostomum lignano TaxID=282301 RepID=A0A1I8IMI7_9PLAT
KFYFNSRIEQVERERNFFKKLAKPKMMHCSALLVSLLLLAAVAAQPGGRKHEEQACLSVRAIALPRFIGGRKDNVAFYVKSLQSDGSCQFTLMSPTAKYLVELDESKRHPAVCRRCKTQGNGESCSPVVPEQPAAEGCAYKLSNFCELVSVKSNDQSKACP